MPALTPHSRLERIRVLIARLRSGTAVQARDIDSVLSKKQRHAMAEAWKQQIQLRKEKKPDDILEYEKKLSEALLLYGKADQSTASITKRTNKLQRTKSEAFESKAVSIFEDALECLEEMIERDPSLRRWFDRDPDFSAGSEINTDPTSMPRVVTSRSIENRGSVKIAFGLKSKTEIKTEALEQAAFDLEKELAPASLKKAKCDAEAEMGLRLKSKLKGLGKSTW